MIDCDFANCALYTNGKCCSTNETKCNSIPEQFYEPFVSKKSIKIDKEYLESHLEYTSKHLKNYKKQMKNH